MLEVSITSKPMHGSTRALSWKAAADPAPDWVMPPDAELREQALKLEVAELAEKATKAARPIQVATFDC